MHWQCAKRTLNFGGCFEPFYVVLVLEGCVKSIKNTGIP